MIHRKHRTRPPPKWCFRRFPPPCLRTELPGQPCKFWGNLPCCTLWEMAHGKSWEISEQIRLRRGDFAGDYPKIAENSRWSLQVSVILRCHVWSEGKQTVIGTVQEGCWKAPKTEGRSLTGLIQMRLWTLSASADSTAQNPSTRAKLDHQTANRKMRRQRSPKKSWVTVGLSRSEVYPQMIQNCNFKGAK